MKTSFVLLALFCVSCSTSGGGYTRQQLENLPRNEVPMYGGESITAKDREINDEFVDSVLVPPTTRDEAYRQFVSRGWEYYHKKDFQTAIKRFNQAWLFKTDDYEVYWGFGLILSARGQFDEPVKLLEKAVVMNSNNSKLITDLAYTYTIVAHLAGQLEGENVDRAVALYSRAELTGGNDGQNYYDWSVQLFYIEKYSEAREKLDLAMSAGFKEVDPIFRQELARGIRKEKRKEWGLLY